MAMAKAGDKTQQPVQSRPTTAGIFRQRLQAVLDRSGLNQAAFARLTQVDRSTLSQLLQADGPRLPRADTLVAVASACHVSADWLLGLTQREEIGSEIVEAMLQVESHARVPIDERFVGWLREAEGYRIRTVPEGIPDFLKTEEVIRFEYHVNLSQSDSGLEAVEARLATMRRTDGDLEVCSSVQAFSALAQAEGKWNGLSLAARRRQIRHIIQQIEELYPSLRLYLYTLTDTYANPFTLFGPKRVVLFLGTHYLVLNGADHVRLFHRRFDELIRQAVVHPNQVTSTLQGLLAKLG